MSIREINEQTSLPFKTVIPIVTAILMGVLWTNNKLNSIEHGIERSWTVEHQQLWADRLKSANPTIRVPSVESVRSGNRDRETVDAGPTLGMKQ